MGGEDIGSSLAAVCGIESGIGVAFGAGVSDGGGAGSSDVAGPAMASAACRLLGGSNKGILVRLQPLSLGARRSSLSG